MSQFSMRLDPDFKKETQENFKKMGLDMSTATKMFYTFVNRHGYLPLPQVLVKLHWNNQLKMQIKEILVILMIILVILESI